MQLECIWLYPRAAFHFGERGIGLEETSLVLHSDTLFSALCAAWQVLYGNETLSRELLPPEDGGAWQPPFFLSSAFPFAGGVRFYPRPFLPVYEAIEADGRTDVSQRDIEGWHKQLKEVEWVSEGVFIALLQGGYPHPPTEGKLIHDGTVWITHEEAEQLREQFRLRSLEGERFWMVMKAPRVTLDVETSASEIWHFGRVIFREPEDHREICCGYHFFVRYLEESFAERVRAALRLLGDIGIGGDRTSGHGLFTPEFSQGPQWAQLQSASAFITLSLVYPKPEETSALLNEASRYRLIKRGGWIGGVRSTPWRRKTVRMVAEGSRLGGDPAQAWGDLVDVTPDDFMALGLPHRVYRWGFAFPVGVRS